MPLYEYKCDDCGQQFEKIQKFSDPPVSTCLFCSGKVKKLVSSAAIQFKGTGWYVTDYARKTSSEQADSSGARPGSAKTNDSSKRESSKDEKTSSDKTTSSEKTPKPSSSENK